MQTNENQTSAAPTPVPSPAAASAHEPMVVLGDAIRAIEGRPEGTVGGYLVPFTDASRKDLYGTYFTAETYYGKRAGDGMDVLVQHGMPIEGEIDGVTYRFDELARRTMTNAMATRIDDLGIWAEIVLNMADEYERYIFDLVQAGVLRWSSGALSHTLDVADDGFVRRWMIGEGSFTPTPGTPFGRTQITTLRSLEPARLPATVPVPDAVRAGAVLNRANKNDLTTARDLIDGVLARATPAEEPTESRDVEPAPTIASERSAPLTIEIEGETIDVVAEILGLRERVAALEAPPVPADAVSDDEPTNDTPDEETAATEDSTDSEVPEAVDTSESVAEPASERSAPTNRPRRFRIHLT